MRYTVRLGFKPDNRVADFTVVTSMGELKAAAVAAMRQCDLDPDVHLYSVEIVRVEVEYTVDVHRDIVDYWEVA